MGMYEHRELKWSDQTLHSGMLLGFFLGMFCTAVVIALTGVTP